MAAGLTVLRNPNVAINKVSLYLFIYSFFIYSLFIYFFILLWFMYTVADFF